jgi:hypothetical protein
LSDHIRKEFDRTVLNAFGIGNYHDRIINSLKVMRRIRKAVKQHAAELRPLRGKEGYEPMIEQMLEHAAEDDMYS